MLGKPPVNHKRVYRLMRQNGLLLARHTGTGRQRSHDGVVRTLCSNLRWCSDVFEVPCWNGNTVRVAFVLDTCDREVITWTAAPSVPSPGRSTPSNGWPITAVPMQCLYGARDGASCACFG